METLETIVYAIHMIALFGLFIQVFRALSNKTLWTITVLGWTDVILSLCSALKGEVVSSIILGLLALLWLYNYKTVKTKLLQDGYNEN